MSSGPQEEPPDSLAAARIGAVLKGRYQIVQLLGSGGMGLVYRATDLIEQRPVAIKVLHREMNDIPEVVARFEREAVAARRIVHPHVTAAGEVGVLEDGAHFLALEFVSGDRLTVAIAERPFPPARALRVARQVALALAAAHGAGVVHRDLKPDNIMLVDRDGPDDFVKVLDFGIAKLTMEDARGAPQLTRMGAVFGTPEYMAPEQARGVPVDHRADLYALGVIVYEMLAGRPPFQSADVTELLEAQLKHAPRELPARVPASVRAIVAALLEKTPAKRLGSAEELIARIDAALATDPALAGASPGPRVDGVGADRTAGGAGQALAPTRFLPFGGTATKEPAPSTPPGHDAARSHADAEARLAPTLLDAHRAAAVVTGRAVAGTGHGWRAGLLRYERGIGSARVPGWLLGVVLIASALSLAVAALAVALLAG